MLQRIDFLIFQETSFALSYHCHVLITPYFSENALSRFLCVFYFPCSALHGRRFQFYSQ